MSTAQSMGLVRYYDIAIGYVIVPIFRYTLYCECCERECVTASNQSVYNFEGCVAEYVHASK